MLKIILMALVSAATLSAGGVAQIPETALDHALVAGGDDPALRPAFYELLLESRVFVAVVPDAATEGRQQIGESFRGTAPDDSVMLAFAVSEFEGLPVFNVFDTEQRLLDFLSRRPLGQMEVVELPVLAVLDSHRGDAFLYLNPETPFAKFLGVEEVRWLRGRGAAPLTRTSAAAADLAALEPISTGRDSLLAAIGRAARQIPEIAEVWLMAPPSGDGEPDEQGMILLIGLTPLPDYDRIDEIITALGPEIQGLVGEGHYLDMAPLSLTQARELAAGAEPQYRRD